MKNALLLCLVFAGFVHAAPRLGDPNAGNDAKIDRIATAPRAGAQKPLDPQKLSEKIRYALAVPGHWKMTLGPLSPSPFSDFYQAQVVCENKQERQEQSLLIAKSGDYFVLGKIYDLTADPERERLKKMNLNGAAYKGPEKAPVTIVEYSDLQDSASKKSNQNLSADKIVEDYKGQVRWITKHTTLDSDHDWFAAAAVACFCAAKQNPQNFWPAQNFFFDQQNKISKKNVPEKIMQIAMTLNLDMSAFRDCYSAGGSLEEIKKNIVEANEVGIVRTPSFVVNEKLFSGEISETDLRAAIDSALQNLKK